VFLITGDKPNVAISGVNIRHGLSSGDSSSGGGGIYNLDGTLTLTNSTVSDNTANANGGGIWNSGALTLTNSTISGNNSDPVGAGSFSSRVGGGIFNLGPGTLTIANSTVSGNTAGGGGGGIYDWALGAVVGSVTVINSTISGNTATGGGGLFNNTASIIKLINTIVANNPSNGDCRRHGVTSLGHNLDSDGTCGFNATGDKSNVNPKLGPLQDNSGPTWTHALLAGSPAIDAGNPAAPGSEANACPDKDQRGIARPQDGNGNGTARCDIGAYELKP